jgi:HSP20 family molecular chaperone IbpA
MMGADPRTWMWTEACAMIERAERLQRQFFRPSLSSTPSASWEPPVDILESDEEVRIIVALPGVEPQDIKVYLDSGELVIQGLRELPAVTRAAAIHRLEIPYGRFERRIPLPAAVDIERSDLGRGCLSLSLMKQF